MPTESSLSAENEELVEMDCLPTIQEAIEASMAEPVAEFAGISQSVVNEVLNHPEFRNYQLDQSYRWVIRNFLLSASVQGTLSDAKLESYLAQASTAGGRERLAAALMLLPVEHANDIPEMVRVEVQSFPDDE